MKFKTLFTIAALILSSAVAPIANAATLFTINYNENNNTTTWDFNGAPLSSAITGGQFVVLKDYGTTNSPGWGPNQFFGRTTAGAADIGFQVVGNDLFLYKYASNPAVGFASLAGDYLLSSSSSLNGGTTQYSDVRTVTAASALQVLVVPTQGSLVGATNIGTYDVTVTSAVPEPGISAFAGLGCVGLMMRRRRKA